MVLPVFIFPYTCSHSEYELFAVWGLPCGVCLGVAGGQLCPT